MEELGTERGSHVATCSRVLLNGKITSGEYPVQAAAIASQPPKPPTISTSIPIHVKIADHLPVGALSIGAIRSTTNRPHIGGVVQSVRTEVRGRRHASPTDRCVARHTPPRAAVAVTSVAGVGGICWLVGARGAGAARGAATPRVVLTCGAIGTPCTAPGGGAPAPRGVLISWARCAGGRRAA